MDHLYALFALLLVLAAVLGGVAIRGQGRVAVRFGAVAALALFIPVTYGTLIDLLGRPKPASLEWVSLNVAEAQVLGSQIREGVGIYLWLALPDVDEPRAYVLPWDRSAAEQLQQAQQEAGDEGNGVMVTFPFDSDDQSGPNFYAPPQPAMPAKKVADGSHIQLVHPRNGSAR